MKELTLQPATKEDHGKRYFVIAQRYTNLKVVAFGTSWMQVAKLFRNRFEGGSDNIPIEFGEAVCHVNKRGTVSWGCFEQLNARSTTLIEAGTASQITTLNEKINAEHTALVAVAEAADKVIKASNFLLEAQRQGDDDAMAHAHIALYAELDNLSTIRNSNK